MVQNSVAADVLGVAGELAAVDGQVVAPLEAGGHAQVVQHPHHVAARQLFQIGLGPAAPGEFSKRAYVNGKLDLAQAEAVNEIVAGSNRFQIEAAERLLSGRLTATTRAVHSALVDCLSLIEAGLDFSTEDIAFIGPREAVGRLGRIKSNLEGLLSGSIRYESLIDLPSVGIAGAPNAGKSSLLNAMLGHERSLVSDRPRTTRDVLSGLLTTDRLQCVLFDCAGLLTAPESILDRLAQQAAIEALRRCQVVIFCVDAAKPGIREDLAIRALIRPETVLYVATKADLLNPADSQRAVETLAQAFAGPFLAVSALTGQGLRQLQDLIARPLSAGPQAAAREGHDAVTLTARHRQAVSEAIANIGQAMSQIEQGAEEVAAAMIREACQALSEIEQQPIDEQILDRIFSRFCVGK